MWCFALVGLLFTLLCCVLIVALKLVPLRSLFVAWGVLFVLLAYEMVLVVNSRQH